MEVLLMTPFDSLKRVLTLMAKAYMEALVKDKNSPDISLQQPVVGPQLDG